MLCPARSDPHDEDDRDTVNTATFSRTSISTCTAASPSPRDSSWNLTTPSPPSPTAKMKTCFVNHLGIISFSRLVTNPFETNSRQLLLRTCCRYEYAIRLLSTHALEKRPTKCIEMVWSSYLRLDHLLRGMAVNRTFGISEKIEFKRSFDRRRSLIARDDSLSLSL